MRGTKTQQKLAHSHWPVIPIQVSRGAKDLGFELSKACEVGLEEQYIEKQAIPNIYGFKKKKF